MDLELDLGLSLLHASGALLVAIALVVVVVLFTRLDAFVGLLLGAIAVGAVAGAPMDDTLTLMTTGFGNTLGNIGIVIGLGVMIGKILEKSGGADALAQAFLRIFGRGREDWAMVTTGTAVSVPVFCDSGYVIMHPLSRSLARRSGRSFVTLALALGAGMTITHHLVPPTPGPLGAAGILGADLGGLILAGLAFTPPLAVVVVLYSRWIGPKLDDEVIAEVREAVQAGARSGSGATSGVSDGPGPDETPVGGGTDGTGGTDANRIQMGGLRAFIPLLVPLLLIVGNTVSAAIDEEAQLTQVLGVIGAPSVALVIGLILAVYLLLPLRTPRSDVQGWLLDGAASAGSILLITGAGGALGWVLGGTGVGDTVAEEVATWALPGFLVPFIIATLVRFAQGSGTVAMITAATLTAPLLDGLGLSPLLAALAACAGSMFLSYYNDSYFWVVTRFTGLEGTAALKGWSGITTALWAASIPLLALAALVL